MVDYVDNFTTALNNPSPTLENTFTAEEQFLQSFLADDAQVLAVGVESARPLPALANHASSITAVADSEKGVDWMTQHVNGVDNVEFVQEPFNDLPYKDNVFDLVYSSYNVVGSVSDEVRPGMIREMVRVLTPGSHVVNITWKNDAATTDFLAEYYPRIGINVETINTQRTITEKGMFRRMQEDELVELYAVSGVDNVMFENVGPVWQAAVGIKPE